MGECAAATPVVEDERLLKAVFDLLPVGVWIADATGHIVSNNPAGERIWGGARHVPMAQFGEYRGWWADSGKLIAPEEWSMARAIRYGQTSTGELVRIQCFDGSFKTIINSAAPLRDGAGNIAGAIVVNEDITGLHDAQEKQKASEQLFRTVFELLPVGLWIADSEGRITLGNPAGDRICQGIRHVSPERYGDNKAWWVDTGEPIVPEDWGIARAVRRGQSSRSELMRIQCFDGSFKTVINWAAPILSDAGKITGAVAVNEDITALHQTQVQLRAAVRDREDILGVVAHDLRNPLTALTLLAETARAKAARLPGGDELQAAASEIAEITKEMSGLVNDLLAIAVEGPGRSMLKTAPVKAASLLVSAAAAAQPLFARAGIQLVVEPGGELPDVHVDRPRILRVFANLFDNALKFTHAPGRTVVRSEVLSGSVRFTVANSGPPLRQEERDRMLQPFWQADRHDPRGAGLGLSICRSIVEAHGGSIWAEPAEGMQVQISFVLPCVNRAAARAA